jgi:hypothetical protein
MRSAITAPGPTHRRQRRVGLTGHRSLEGYVGTGSHLPHVVGRTEYAVFHPCASGHGEQVVATNHVTPGTARAPCYNDLPGSGHSLTANTQRPGVNLVGKRRGETVAPQQAGVRLDHSGSTLAATKMS